MLLNKIFRCDPIKAFKAQFRGVKNVEFFLFRLSTIFAYIQHLALYNVKYFHGVGNSINHQLMVKKMVRSNKCSWNEYCIETLYIRNWSILSFDDL